MSEATTPAALAERWGVPERRIRSIARRLGACRIFGKTMLLLPEDVAAILEHMRAPKSYNQKTIEEQAARIAELEAELTLRSRAAIEAQTGIGFIYFAQGERDHVKIGFAKDVAKRIKQLQTSFPYRLTLLATMTGSRDDEQALHEQFRDLRIGGEWFYYTGALKEFINGGGNG